MMNLRLAWTMCAVRSCLRGRGGREQLEPNSFLNKKTEEGVRSPILWASLLGAEEQRKWVGVQDVEAETGHRQT